MISYPLFVVGDACSVNNLGVIVTTRGSDLIGHGLTSGGGGNGLVDKILDYTPS